MNFRDWLILNEIEATSAKTGLYPLGYGGIGLYPSLYFMPVAGDAVYYVTQDERLYQNGENAPNKITQIPGKPSWKHQRQANH